jgi:hypothetical protein
VSEATTSNVPDTVMQGVDAALLRAAQRAREIARETATSIVVMIDGVLMEDRCDGTPPTPITPVT